MLVTIFQPASLPPDRSLRASHHVLKWFHFFFLLFHTTLNTLVAKLRSSAVSPLDLALQSHFFLIVLIYYTTLFNGAVYLVSLTRPKLWRRLLDHAHRILCSGDSGSLRHQFFTEASGHLHLASWLRRFV